MKWYCDNNSFPKTMVKYVNFSPFKKSEKHCPMCLSITSRINLRRNSCSWNIDCAFSSGPESVWGDSPIFKREGDAVEVSLIFFFRILVLRIGVHIQSNRELGTITQRLQTLKVLYFDLDILIYSFSFYVLLQLTWKLL